MVEIINSLKQYGSLYEFIGKQPRTKDDICQYATDVLGKKSRTTVLKYANQAFDGNIPLLIVKDELISIDVDKYRAFIETLNSMFGVDVGKVFQETTPSKKKKPEDDIAKVTVIEAPIIKEYRTKVNELEAELSKVKAAHEQVLKEMEAENQRIADEWQRKLEQLKNKRAKKVCANIATEMDNKVIVTSTIHSVAPEHLARDFFLDDSHWQIDVPYQVSKYGGEKDSFLN